MPACCVPLKKAGGRLEEYVLTQGGAGRKWTFHQRGDWQFLVSNQAPCPWTMLV
jgi:hypothetical protein